MYNESNNIQKCIKNLCEQSNQNFDVIFIDDGSKDNTIFLLEDCLKKNQVKFNIKILSQTNQGAAAARKLGIEESNSEYIMFLDCDDYVSNFAVDLANRILLVEDDFDILMPNLLIEEKNNQWKNFEFYSNETNVSGIKCLENSFGGWRVHGCNIYRKKIVLEAYLIYYGHNMERNNYINNDEIITRVKFFLSRKVLKIDYSYNYCNNGLSTTKSFNPKMYLVVNNSFILNDIFKSKEYKILLCKEHINTFWNLLSYLKKYSENIDDKNNWLSHIDRGLNLVDPMILIKKDNIKFYIKYLLLKFYLFFKGV